MQDLLAKYDRAGPRYTSYPTAPVWAEFRPEDLEARLGAVAAAVAAGHDRPLSLYFHIPFCQQRCLYCGCHVLISSKGEGVSGPYLQRIHREIELFRAHLGSARKVVQIHLGGGTPTYLTPQQLAQLRGWIDASFSVASDAEISVEVDPCVTSVEHVRRLRELGFNRISLGLQDLDREVQEAVQRVQTKERTAELFHACRDLGFTGINIDLMYGLPHQTAESYTRTLEQVIAWRPDRLAVFNYAHVPWLKPHQKKLPEKALPSVEEKMALFGLAREHLMAAGYEPIGMDHFALPEDELTQARQNEVLRRNFMGYTTKPETDILAFGLSSISEVDGAYAQNATKLADYYRSIDAGKLAIRKGCQLTDDDRVRRDVIMGIMCNFALDYSRLEQRHGIDFKRSFATELEELAEYEADGLVRRGESRLEVTALGQQLVRNIAMVFDAYLRRAPTGGGPLYSRTV